MKTYTKTQIDRIPEKGRIGDLWVAGISKQIVNHWIQNSGFPATRVGQHWMYYKVPVVKWLIDTGRVAQ